MTELVYTSFTITVHLVTVELDLHLSTLTVY